MVHCTIEHGLLQSLFLLAASASSCCAYITDYLTISSYLLEQLCCLLQRGYEGNWLGGTFSKAVFLGNGLIAIVAGLLGHALVEIFQLGPVSPFDAAALVLIGGGVYIALTWTENYGDSADKAPFHTSLVNAGKTIWEGDLFRLHAWDK